MGYPEETAARLVPVAQEDVETQARFISRTYYHLLAAILAFVGIEILLFQTGLALPIARALLSTSWLVVLGGFVLAGWIASGVAHHARSLAAQYAALGAYVLAEAIIFVPLLAYAQRVAKGGVIESAASVTILAFMGLTVIVHVTRKDFSFLRGMLFWGAISALVLITAGLVFGFSLGLCFSVGMVVYAGAAILYATSNVIHYYPEDRYVAASLELFASAALLFWYVLQLFLVSRD